MDTIGDVIGRGWNAGRGIGQDFASWKYSRGEAKLRQQLEAEAKAANQPLEQFIANNPERLRQYEDAARELYTTSGAQKRGVTGSDGSPLYADTATSMQERLALGTNRAASQQVLAGDVEQSQRTLAGGNALVGNYDATRANALQADQIQNATAAINPDGSFDPVKASAGLPAISARQGDTAGAVAGQDAARQLRFKVAQQHSGDLQMMMSDPAAYGMDTIVGKLNALIGLDGRFGTGVLAQADKSGGITLMRGDQPLMTLMQNGQPTKYVTDFLANASTDYEGAVQKHVEDLRGQADAETKRTGEIQMEAFKAGLDIAKNMAKVDPAAGTAASTLASAMSAAKDAGWELNKQDDTTSVLTDKSGRVFVMKFNPEPQQDPHTGRFEPSVEVTDTDGNRVSPEMLQGAPEIAQITQAAIAFDAAQQQSQVAQRGELAKMGVQLISALTQAMGAPVDMGGATSRIGGALGGKGGSRAERNNNPGNIKDVGQFDGMPGYKGKDKAGFAMFETPEQGTAAMHAQLQRYMDGKTTGKPLRSVAEIVGTWSPQADPQNAAGSTDNYAAYVAEKLGVDPTQPLPPSAIPQLAQAMFEFESGNTSGQAMGAADTATATATSSPISTEKPGNSVAKANDGVKLPSRSAVAKTNPSKDVQALSARRQVLEQAIREFNAQESTSPISAWTPGGEAVGEGLDPAQQRQFAALSRELQQVKTAERQARIAAQRNARASSEQQEITRMQEKYGLPPADPDTAAALARWAR